MTTMRSPFVARRSAATSPIPEVAPVMTMVLPATPCSADDFEFAEEEADFVVGGLGRVGAVHGIGFDRFGEILAYRFRSRLHRIGCAHNLAIAQDRLLAFQHLHDHGTGAHEFDQAAEER